MSIKPPEYEIVTASRVCCDGSGPALGHPRVFLSVDPAKGYVECGYCDKLFIAADRAEELLASFGIKDGAAA